MINLLWVVLSFVLCIHFGRVLSETKTILNDDIMVVKGNSCNSSEIKLMLIDWNVSKIFVYLTHTFYADEDLKLNGITELQIFANTWHCTQPVTFDLSGSDGESQELPKVKGSPGSKGNDGKNGGSFIGLTKHTINGNYLRVISNGGNGGDGQAGAASDDVFVLWNVENDTGDSGWFSSGDLHNYYKKYFSDRGYDGEISDIDDYTSFYAVFVHDKKASFNIRLHPLKCCGTTGVGGPGGHGGRRGEFVFKHLGKSRSNSETTPTFAGNNGPIGKLGKDGETCENRALDVRIDVELKEVVVIFLPVHHSFSSKFTALNHTNSSKCSPTYVRSNETTVEAMKPIEVDVVFSIVFYKIFLLNNMKNESQKSMAQDMYTTIDDNWDVNKHNSLRGLLLEAYELEKRFFELRKAINVKQLYKRLYYRVQNYNPTRGDEDEERARQCLQSILQSKLNDLETDYNLIVNLEQYIEIAVWRMDIRNDSLPEMPHFNDFELENHLKQLQFEVNGQFILAEYEHVIKGFQLTYFPFAVKYSEKYNISTSLSDYRDLNDIHLTAINKLRALNETIRQVKWMNAEIMMNLNYADISSPSNAFFIWKYANNGDHIRKLFAGETITLLADVKQSAGQYNAMKFNKIDLYFRSSEQNVTDELNNVLKHLEVNLKHNGVSQFRCNNHFYQFITDPLSLFFSFRKDVNDVPMTRVLTYDLLLNNQPTLSPYASWDVQIVSEDKKVISQLIAFDGIPIDIELHGTGKYIMEDVQICENKDLVKVYTQI